MRDPGSRWGSGVWHRAGMRTAAIVCGLLVMGAAVRAGATSCAPPWGQLRGNFGPVRYSEPREVPVDAWPWEYADCGFELSDECVLRSGEQVVAVTVETTGRDGCETSAGGSLDGLYVGLVRQFVPDEPLAPGLTYTLECGDAYPEKYVMTRTSTAASAPPGTLAIVGAEFRQGDPGCCGGGDYLEVQFAGMEEAYLEEGGYIEVVYPEGEVGVIGGDGVVEFPEIEGVFRFTPVAADGERGETIELDTDEAGKEAVFVPCSVDPRGGSRGLWLVAPLIWVGVQARRRRRWR